MLFRSFQVVDKLNEIFEGLPTPKLAVILFGGLAATELVRHLQEGFIQVVTVHAKCFDNGVRFPKRELFTESELLELGVHRARNGLHFGPERRYEGLLRIKGARSGYFLLTPPIPSAGVPHEGQHRNSKERQNDIQSPRMHAVSSLVRWAAPTTGGRLREPVIPLTLSGAVLNSVCVNSEESVPDKR
jgi:hypothetical protein